MTLGIPGVGVLPFEFGISLHVERARNGGVSDSKRLQQCIVHKSILFLETMIIAVDSGQQE